MAREVDVEAEFGGNRGVLIELEAKVEDAADGSVSCLI